MWGGVANGAGSVLAGGWWFAKEERQNHRARARDVDVLLLRMYAVMNGRFVGGFLAAVGAGGGELRGVVTIRGGEALGGDIG